MSLKVDVELLLVPECPHGNAARELLTRCLAGLEWDIAVAERIGDFPSPTILVNGRDVMTGRELTANVVACRLDVPTEPQLRAALAAAAAA
jgi:hypothetical protein